MGQYYYLANLTRREYLHPHRAGNGLKLMEFSGSGDGVMQLLAILLASSNNRGGGDLRSDHPIIGTWAGDRIAVVGDYDDEGKFFDVVFDQIDVAVAIAEMQQLDPEGGPADKDDLYTDFNVYRLCSMGYFKDVTGEAMKAVIDGEGDYSSFYWMDRTEDSYPFNPSWEVIQQARFEKLTPPLTWDMGRALLERYEARMAKEKASR